MINEVDSNARDVVVVGSGPAGYTAAIYAARSGLRPVVFAGAPTLDDPERLPGGQLLTTSRVENFPGFPSGIDGFDLMDRMREQAEQQGATVLSENAAALDLSLYPFLVRGEATAIRAKSVILATGASAKWLGVDGEERFRGRGVSACATCDGPLFAGRDVTVVGGGDTALEEALYLARVARSVRVVSRGAELRGSRPMQLRALQESKIHFVRNRVVEGISGNEQGVTGIRLREVGGAAIEDIATDAVFVAIGHTPATALLGGQLRLDARGYVMTAPGSTQTSVAGVFACGDVQDSRYRQAITAAGSGCMAALDAERWLGATQAPASIAAA